MIDSASDDSFEFLALDYRNMKITAWPQGILKLSDLTTDPREFIDVSSHQSYACAFAIGKRLLKEARSRKLKY